MKNLASSANLLRAQALNERMGVVHGHGNSKHI